MDSCHHGESIMNVNEPTTAKIKAIKTPLNAPNAVPSVVSIPDKLSTDNNFAMIELTIAATSKIPKNIEMCPKINCMVGLMSNWENKGAP